MCWKNLNAVSLGGAADAGADRSRKLRTASGQPFWQRRYYDFNVWSSAKLGEKLDYLHNNPVRRGLVQRPEDWPWSSFGITPRGRRNRGGRIAKDGTPTRAARHHATIGRHKA